MDIDHVSAPLYRTLKDRDHQFRYCTSNLLELAGMRDVADIYGLTDNELPWGYFAEVYSQGENIALKGEISQSIVPFRDFNGKHCLHYNIKMPHLDEHNKIAGVITRAFEIESPMILEMINFLLKIDPQTDLPYYSISCKGKNQICLSEREKEVLFYILRGRSARCIGNVLGLSARTIESYTENIKSKFGCHSRAELIDKAIDNGFITMLPKGVLPKKFMNSLAKVYPADREAKV